jgi:hypothetical protein
MAFKKGYDPNRNTGGKPRRTPDGRALPELAREHTAEAVKVVEDILFDAENHPDTRLKAAALLFNRGWGQAKQTVDVNGTVKQNHLVASIDISALSLDAAKQLLDALNAPQDQPIEAQLIDANAPGDTDGAA